MSRNQWKNAGLLLITAMIWGAAFVAQSVGMDYVGPYTFLASRSFLGGTVLLPVIALMNRKNPADEGWKQPKLLKGGICCGIALCVASLFQQIGIQYTSVGKAGFLTTLYVVIVPFLGVLFLKKKLRPLIWVCVALSLAGLYLLCMTGGMEGLAFGDTMVLLCALCFSVHILVIDYFSPQVDPVRMSCIQFFVCGTICLIGALILEHPDWNMVVQAWMPICYAGILSGGVGYTLQVVAQKDCDPTVASLVMCLESVFSVLFGWLLLHQTLSARELAGCALVFGAVVLAQLPERAKN